METRIYLIAGYKVYVAKVSGYYRFAAWWTGHNGLKRSVARRWLSELPKAIAVLMVEKGDAVQVNPDDILIKHF